MSNINPKFNEQFVLQDTPDLFKIANDNLQNGFVMQADDLERAKQVWNDSACTQYERLAYCELFTTALKLAKYYGINEILFVTQEVMNNNGANITRIDAKIFDLIPTASEITKIRAKKLANVCLEHYGTQQIEYFLSHLTDLKGDTLIDRLTDALIWYSGSSLVFNYKPITAINS